MNITLNPKLLDTLTRVATANGRTPESYVEFQITQILLAQVKEDMIRKIETQTVEDIQTFESTIQKIDADITARNLAAEEAKESEIVEEVI